MESLSMTPLSSKKMGIDTTLIFNADSPALGLDNMDQPTACLEHTDYHALAQGRLQDTMIHSDFSDAATLSLMPDPLWSLDSQTSALDLNHELPPVSPLNIMADHPDVLCPEQALLPADHFMMSCHAVSQVDFTAPLLALPPTPPKADTPPKAGWAPQELVPPWQVMQFTPSMTPNVHAPQESGSTVTHPVQSELQPTRPTFRRRSADHSFTTPKQRRRASSQPSVASVVSLSAHEPVEKTIDGVPHITFLYSHDRLVREYTVCTDVDSLRIEDIPLDFRAQNVIYPRANVAKSEYDGNRWSYETTCNELGWKLCWLNKAELCGKRGLIQRAVDSYRNRHFHMRSRRVTRQEKVANGTLRKRRSRKSC